MVAFSNFFLFSILVEKYYVKQTIQIKFRKYDFCYKVIIFKKLGCEFLRSN